MPRYRDLHAWKHCRTLTIALYAATRGFPREELYGLTSQIRRAGVSSVANVAEGSSRSSRSEFGRFLEIAVSSLTEIDALLDLSFGLGFLDERTLGELSERRDEAARVTFSLRRSLKRRERRSGIPV